MDLYVSAFANDFMCKCEKQMNSLGGVGSSDLCTVTGCFCVLLWQVFALVRKLRFANDRNFTSPSYSGSMLRHGIVEGYMHHCDIHST